jgi:glycyl-tRNA synthetase beta chain
VWKAIYFHYLPTAVEADAPPTKTQLGKAAAIWAAVSLADKLDTLVGLFAAGEKPTGSRDPYGLRRAAQGVVRILVDTRARVSLAQLVDQAFAGYGASLNVQNVGWRAAVFDFLGEREEHLLDRRGFKYDEIRAVMHQFRATLNPYETWKRAEALAQVRNAKEFEALAVLFKRVKNITREFARGDDQDLATLRHALKEPAELALLGDLERRWPKIEHALRHEQFLEAMNQLAPLHAPVDKFFVDVLVMAEEPALREARLALLATLRDTVLRTSGDISEIAPEER